MKHGHTITPFGFQKSTTTSHMLTSKTYNGPTTKNNHENNIPKTTHKSTLSPCHDI